MNTNTTLYYDGEEVERMRAKSRLCTLEKMHAPTAEIESVKAEIAYHSQFVDIKKNGSQVK